MDGVAQDYEWITYNEVQGEACAHAPVAANSKLHTTRTSLQHRPLLCNPLLSQQEGDCRVSLGKG